MRTFENKVFVVTGAGSGIGRALALELHKRGARLALNDVSEEALKQTAKQLNASCITGAFSVSDRASWSGFREQVINAYDHVDGAINNAGIAHEAVAVEHLNVDDLHKVMDVNFYGVVHGTQTFLPDLITRDDAAIVNISSIFGVTAVGLQSAYCASKFAVKGFTESLRAEAQLYYPNLLVTVVHPGGIQTDIADNAISAGSRTDAERKKDMDAFKRNFINTPEFAAQTIVEGIQKNRTRILIGGDARILDLTARIMPSNYTKLIIKRMRKENLVDETLLAPIDKRLD
ncbi:SDR family NAD(P)-dependent oxidoreductase [Ningiella sp. W23]|uniref:SDR family NAD(P)-dependent oxidoreductase n=1 Tax=Ningiella sp. W23 TaxID=3023715 RepID=UPI0037570D5C